jgi:hyperosmotically inducible periplasmic protein
MRFDISVAALSIAALLAAGPAMAQGTTEKPTTTEKIEQKADDTKNKVKDTAHEAKTGMTDSWVTAKTKIALFSDDRVKGRQVSVETQKGVVTLRGKVDSAEAKAAAADIAKGIDSVKSVRNELQVVAPSQRNRVDADDKQIAKSVEQRFKQDSQLKSAKIDAKVEAGVVILTGEVKSIDTSARASEVARSVPGVRYVKNDLTFASRSSLESPRAYK